MSERIQHAVEIKLQQLEERYRATSNKASDTAREIWEEATLWCDGNEVPHPPWLAAATSLLVSKKRGPGNPGLRPEAHLARWYWAERFEVMQHNGWLDNCDCHIEAKGKPCDGDPYEHVANIMTAGCAGWTRADTVRKSVEKMRRVIADGTSAEWFASAGWDHESVRRSLQRLYGPVKPTG